MGAVPEPLDEALPALLDEAELDDVLALDDVLTRLQQLDARVAAVVEHRVFGGLTLDETAAVLGVSAKTVQHNWITAQGLAAQGAGGAGAGVMS